MCVPAEICSGQLLWGAQTGRRGVPTLPQCPQNEITVVFFFFLIIFFSAAKCAHPTHTLLSHKSDLSQPRRKQKWVFLWVFTGSAVKPGVPERGVEAAKPQTSLQDPAQVFLESITSTVGMGSIFALSSVLQHPIATVAVLQKLSCFSPCWCNY